VNNRLIVALVKCGRNLCTFYAAHADKVTVAKIVTDNIAKESRLHTDESRLYFGPNTHFADYETVRNSSGEYIRGDVHTNSVDYHFGIFTRRKRYLAEYASKYKSDLAYKFPRSETRSSQDCSVACPKSSHAFSSDG